MSLTTPHSRDLRTGRFSEIGRIYLITTVTQQRTPVFKDLFPGRHVVQCLRHQHEQKHVESLAYVLMPDHLHWLFQLTDSTPLATVINQVKSYSSLQINKHYGQCGALWQPGYHDHAVRKDEDILQLARYILANPLRAGLVERLADYPLWDASWID